MKTAEMRKALLDALESAGVKLVDVADGEPAEDSTINYICGWLCSSVRAAPRTGGQMKSWQCVYCAEKVHEVSAYVKISSNRYAHVRCYDSAVSADAVDNYLRVKLEQETLSKLAQEEIAKVRELAAKNAALEKQRVASLVQSEKDKLLGKNSGESQDRFALVASEIDEDFAAKTQAEKAKAAQDLAAKQEADAHTCVRCRKPMPEISKEHPRHCSACWNDESTGQKAGIGGKQDIEQQLKDAIKAGVRPLEVD